jgi:hypothetical protein
MADNEQIKNGNYRVATIMLTFSIKKKVSGILGENLIKTNIDYCF